MNADIYNQIANEVENTAILLQNEQKHRQDAATIARLEQKLIWDTQIQKTIERQALKVIETRIADFTAQVELNFHNSQDDTFFTLIEEQIIELHGISLYISAKCVGHKEYHDDSKENGAGIYSVAADEHLENITVEFFIQGDDTLLPVPESITNPIKHHIKQTYTIE